MEGVLCGALLRHLSQIVPERAHFLMQVGDGTGESLQEGQQRGRLSQFLRHVLRHVLRRRGIEVASRDEGLTAEAMLGVEG